MGSSYFKRSLVVIPIITNLLILSSALHTDTNDGKITKTIIDYKDRKNHILYNWNISLLNYNYISDQLPVSQESFIKTNTKEEATIEISDIDLPSNSSLNSTALHAEEKRRADAEWLKDVRMAIEGVTQLIVGLIGLVGKNSKR